MIANMIVAAMAIDRTRVVQVLITTSYDYGVSRQVILIEVKRRNVVLHLLQMQSP
jgi:hypothetical protein